MKKIEAKPTRAQGGLKIGRIAKESGLGIETIRFYERNGLIAEPPRRDSGYRDYPTETVARLRFIKRAKELGFSLKEISEILGLSQSSRETCASMQKRAHAKSDEITAKIADLRRIQKALLQLAATCETRDASSACPILEKFREEG